jgi:hypothetical protein
MRVWNLARQWRRDSELGKRLLHEIVIPCGPDDRPGERFLSPSKSLHPPLPPGPDGSRTDFRVVLSRRASTFGAVCLGPVSDRGEPEASALHSIRAFAERGSSTASPLEPDQVAGEAAVRYQVDLKMQQLVEWKFVHDGWLFVAGALCAQRDDVDKLVARSRRILDTWTWIDVPSLEVR